MKTVGIGIIGGGLMGREMASAFARWCALTDVEVQPELVAVADLVEPVREWFRQIPSCKQITADYKELLANPAVEVVYVAVPHNLHEKALHRRAGVGEGFVRGEAVRHGPGIGAEHRRRRAAHGSLHALQLGVSLPARARSGWRRWWVRAGSAACWRSCPAFITAAIWMRPSPPIGNASAGPAGRSGCWATWACTLAICRCGLAGGRCDCSRSCRRAIRSGPTARAAWRIATPGTTRCCTPGRDIGDHEVPMRLEMKRLAPGETNTWFIEVLGTEGGVRFSTKQPKTLWLFEGGKEQFWKQTDLGIAGMPFKVVTGGIFEIGFADIIQQMWAAFLMEREGKLNGRCGCATVEEAVATQEIFAAALESQAKGSVVAL